MDKRKPWRPAIPLTSWVNAIRLQQLSLALHKFISLVSQLFYHCDAPISCTSSHPRVLGRHFTLCFFEFRGIRLFGGTGVRRGCRRDCTVYRPIRRTEFRRPAFYIASYFRIDPNPVWGERCRTCHQPGILLDAGRRDRLVTLQPDKSQLHEWDS